MCSIKYEYKRGYFIIRPYGRINKYNYSKILNDIDRMIKRFGIRCIVIDVNEIKSIEIICCKRIINYVKKNINRREILLCGNNIFYKRIFNNIIPIINSELELN